MVDKTIEQAMEQAFRDHFLGGSYVDFAEGETVNLVGQKPITDVKRFIRRSKILGAVRTMSTPSYWNRANTIEACGFATKIAIIFPGLLFGRQFWWLYIFAIVSSVALIWSSTVKTLPTIILFNVAWVVLALTAIIKYFA